MVQKVKQVARIQEILVLIICLHCFCNLECVNQFPVLIGKPKPLIHRGLETSCSQIMLRHDALAN